MLHDGRDHVWLPTAGYNELVAELIFEQRNAVTQLKQLNHRVERLEEEQKETNVLLQQHTRDLVKIADVPDSRLIRWGDKAQLGTGTKKVVGRLVRAK